METVIFQGIQVLISGLIMGAIGYFFAVISGKNRAEVRKDDAGAALSYSEAANNAAKMMVDLQTKVNSLEKRVDMLEKENADKELKINALEIENREKDKRISALEHENKELTRRLDSKGLAMK